MYSLTAPIIIYSKQYNILCNTNIIPINCTCLNYQPMNYIIGIMCIFVHIEYLSMISQFMNQTNSKNKIYELKFTIFMVNIKLLLIFTVLSHWMFNINTYF